MKRPLCLFPNLKSIKIRISNILQLNGLFKYVNNVNGENNIKLIKNERVIFMDLRRKNIPRKMIKLGKLKIHYGQYFADVYGVTCGGLSQF